jgi:hypothetical protein
MRMGSGAWSLLRALCADPDSYHEPTDGWRALVNNGYARGDHSGVCATEDGIDLMGAARAVFCESDSMAYREHVWEALTGMTASGRQSRMTAAVLIKSTRGSSPSRDDYVARVTDIIRAIDREGISDCESAMRLLADGVFRRCARCGRHRKHHRAGGGKTRSVCRECTSEMRRKR